jgi:hypothetical protein
MRCKEGQVKKSMLKMSGKSLLTLVLLLCIAGSSLVAYGMFWVTSNIVHVDMQYTVVLSSSASNSVVSLTARVRNNDKPVGAGINVAFYYSLNGGIWTYFATQSTSRGGVAHATYTVTANGAYNFKAIVSSL